MIIRDCILIITQFVIFIFVIIIIIIIITIIIIIIVIIIVIKTVQNPEIRNLYEATAPKNIETDTLLHQDIRKIQKADWSTKQ